MNEWEKEILNSELSEEEKILKYLERIYKEARSECIVKIVELDMRQDFQNISSIVYQKKYQEAILGQINGTLSTLQNDSFSGISDYLNKCYENGYIGAMYDISKQGIPIITPIDSKMVANAIINDSKLSVSMYERLGENVEDLKIRVKTRVSMGIANGQSWAEVASKLANDMNSPFKIAQNNAMRIARTEGGRVQSQAQMDACLEAESKGAKIVKQWDSILDGRTREAHRAIDGEIRELHDPFSNGLMMPRDKDGSAEEVINCRCAMLQRAKWALDEEELEKLEEKARFHGFVDEDGNITLNSYNEFKEKFLNFQGGEITGALNDFNDPDGKSRMKHAFKYYESLRNSDSKEIINSIVKNTDFTTEEVTKFFSHLILEKHDLESGFDYFYPSYDISQSIQRLREGTRILNHDRILVLHEVMESDIMKNTNLSQRQAHKLTNNTFNYEKALKLWKEQNVDI